MNEKKQGFMLMVLVFTIVFIFVILWNIKLENEVLKYSKKVEAWQKLVVAE